MKNQLQYWDFPLNHSSNHLVEFFAVKYSLELSHSSFCRNFEVVSILFDTKSFGWDLIYKMSLWKVFFGKKVGLVLFHILLAWLKL
jgi:hypothetical protein